VEGQLTRCLNSRRLVFCGILLLINIQCAVASAEPAVTAARQPQWDAVFTRQHGWTGGDVAGTVDLGDGRVLWLFGDTWIGDVTAGAHVPGAQMVNNSLAIVAKSLPYDGRAPAPAAVKFYWGPRSAAGKAAAWIAPDGPQPRGWYWPTGGGAIVPGPRGKPRLAIFLFHVGRDERRAGVWAFRSLGGTLALVDNFHEAVEKWRAAQYALPQAISADEATHSDSRKETAWGMATYRSANDAELLYIYGIRTQSPHNKQLLVARVAAQSVETPGAWRYYAGGGRWSARAQRAEPIADDLVSEFSVESCLPGGRQRLVLVHSEANLGRRIFVRTAARPEGPWSSPIEVYRVPEVDRDRSYFAYAAKGHFELSRPGELLISYVVNAHDFGAMFRDAVIYRPRLVSVPLSVVAEAAGTQ
jgi:hypothetical protein